jgi:predicted RNA-binding protein with PIN domain
MSWPSNTLWLVDGYNVLHACLLKQREVQWWQPAYQQLVCTWLRAFAAQNAVRVVFDSSATRTRWTPADDVLDVRHTADADEFLVQTVALEAPLRPVCIVTADRALADRSRARGANWQRPWTFRDTISNASPPSTVRVNDNPSAL